MSDQVDEESEEIWGGKCIDCLKEFTFTREDLKPYKIVKSFPRKMYWLLSITAHLKFQFEQIPFSSGLFRGGISCLVVPDDLQGVHAFGGSPLAA